MKLWYDKPATDWKRGLPIGNGSLGAVVYGDGGQEVWALTESTYWSGKEERTPSRSRGQADLARMRASFFAGEYEEGERLAGELLQPEKGNFGTNLPVCDLNLRFGQEEESFSRELCLDEAIVRASYVAGGVGYERETFVSYPDGVLAARLRGDKPGSVSFEAELAGRTERFSAEAREDGRSLRFEGQAVETTHSDGECGALGRGALSVSVRGGSVTAEAGKLVVRDADEAELLLAFATDYGREGEAWTTEAAEAVARAEAKGYERLKAGHVADYGALFGRVALDLGAWDESTERLPTDVRIRRLRETKRPDPGLTALFYQYGRYLTIAGSRETSRLPLHLQGLWNDGEANRMAWSCDYHLDVNTQMNYYPAETGNLAECLTPLHRFVGKLAEAGRTAARDFYGCGGWVAHVFTNAWGFAAPGWHYSWGLNVTGGLWLAAQLIEHWEFGGDEAFLRDTAYPVLRSAADFYLGYMTEHPANGRLVTGPSNSPENSFYPDEASRDANRAYALSMGPVMDTMLVRQLFAFCLEASRELGEDEAMHTRLEDALRRLPPPAVGRNGQLMEWLEDYGEAQPDHRHLAHLYGLYPGNEITLDGSPELASAARRTLELRQSRGDLEDVEFTLALFAASRARLGDAEEAARHLDYLIGELVFDNLLTFSKPGIAGAETFIFVADGNYGGAAAVAEMLLQSRRDRIELLPALPSCWPEGRYSGLRARGGAEVDAMWERGRLTGATIRAGGRLRIELSCGDKRIRLEMEPGETRSFDGELRVLVAGGLPLQDKAGKTG